MQNPTLEQILNRTELLDFSKTYKYAQQNGITGKPALFMSNESLKIYPLKIKLHTSFCNPQTVINEIETKAKNREVINWFQHGKYVGDYYIEKYSVKVIQKIKNVIVLAEVNLNMLEKPEDNMLFVQNIGIISAAAQKFSLTSAVVKAVTELPNVYDEIMNELKSGNTESKLSSLGAQEFLNYSTQNIMTEIENKGISNASDVIDEYINNMNIEKNFSGEEINIIKSELEAIPTKLYNAAIRKV